MDGLALVGGLTALVVLGTAGAVLLRARRIARRAARLAAEPLEPRSTFPTIAVVDAVHLETCVANERFDACLAGFERGLEGRLGVTEREVVLERGLDTLLHVPLARVAEPELLGRHRDVRAGEHRQILRIGWDRAGVRLSSVFVVEARRKDAERVRREIHLRAGRAAPIWAPPVPPNG